MNSRKVRNTGYVMVMVAMLLAVLCGMAAISIDVGKSLYQQRRIHIATDAAALAAVQKLGPSATYSAINGEAMALGTENSLQTSELDSVQCGKWLSTNRTFTPYANNRCDDTDVNAVRVTGNRTVPVFFGRVFAVSNMTPKVESIAMRVPPANDACIRPFGIELAAFSGVQTGSLITVGVNAPANWGKLDIGGNMSSGTNFESAMLNGVCNVEVAIGEDVSCGTGFGGSIENVFQLLVQQGRQSSMVIAVTSDFPNGNGDVQIENFAKVDFVCDTCGLGDMAGGNCVKNNPCKGGNWQGTFRIVEYPTTPPNSGGTGTATRVLVK